MKVIEIKGLTKSYGKILAVKNLSINVDKGEIYGLLGVNGAGKTTTLECVLGIMNFDKGEVKILGMDPCKKRRELFENISVQFQESNYQEKIMVFELCEQTKCLYRNSLDYKELLKQFDLLDKLKTPISKLSGGQRQKLFIVLALIPNPQVLFLDELTTGLDPRARRDIWNHLLKLKNQGITIFLTSHFMDEIEILCDRITILRKGAEIFNGTVKESILKSGCKNFEDAYLWYTEGENYEYI